MFEEDIERKIASNEKKISVMKMKLERYEKAFSQFFEDAEVTPAELTAFLNQADNFDPDTWALLQEERQKLDIKLNQELNNIRNPLKTTQTYSERKDIQRHWVFVR